MTDGRLVLRAYRVGFGDSFLISSYKSQHRFNILVDLGTKQGCNCGSSFAQVMDDINGTLSTRALDILVISHTHRDHIRGLCPSSDTQSVFNNSPREIWVPRNCDPKYGPTMTHKKLTNLDKCHDRLRYLAQTLYLAATITYHTDVDECISKIEQLYPDSWIRYMDNQEPTYRVDGFDGEFTIDILNPPTKPLILIRAIVDLLPRRILERCGVPAECIATIKNTEAYPNDNELEDDVRLRAKEEDYASLRAKRIETLAEFDIRKEPIPDSKFAGIDIDQETAKAVRRIAEIVCKDKTNRPLKRNQIKNFHNLLNKLDSIDYIDETIAKRAIQQVESRTANNFSLVMQIRWQGRVLLFPGDLQNWNGIKHRINSLDVLKVPHHGSSAEYLNDHDLLSRMFPNNGKLAIIPTCFPTNNCGAMHSRPDPLETAIRLHEYAGVYFTSHFQHIYYDFIVDPY